MTLKEFIDHKISSKDTVEEAVSRRSNSRRVKVDKEMSIEEVKDILDICGFKEKKVPGTGARAVFLMEDSIKKNTRMYFVDYGDDLIWCAFPDIEKAYRICFRSTSKGVGLGVSEASEFEPIWIDRNKVSIKVLQDTEESLNDKEIDSLLEKLNLNIWS